MTEELWSDLVQRGDAEHERRLQSSNLVSREDCPVELTPFGYIRWYLHPRLELPSIQSLYQFELEIPQGSRSGRLTHQGGIVHYVVQGSGETWLDDVAHSWARDDVIGIPARVEGCTFQHVNTGEEAVRLLVAFPNLDSALGPFMGVRFEVTEPAPEYAEHQRYWSLIEAIAGGYGAPW